MTGGAPAEIDAAVDAAVGALLLDHDVTEILALEGGFLEVLRRGRRERLDVVLEGPLFALLREAGAEHALVRLKLRGGQQLVSGPLVDGRTALRIEKGAPLDATLDALAQEGMLPAGVGAELVAAVLEGAGLLVLGPSRTARQRCVAAVVRALQGSVAWLGCTDALAPLVPVPLERDAAVVDKARAAVSLGADAVCGLELHAADVADVARASLGLPLVCSVQASSMEALAAALGMPVGAAAGTSAVIGLGPDGRPRLVELHGPARAADHDDEAPTPGAAATAAPPLGATVAPAVSAVVTAAGRGIPGAFSGAPAPAEVSGLRQRPPGGDVVDEPLPPLGELPHGWASDAPDDDPGWELGDTGAPPPAGSFDAALQSTKSRPSFAPRPPPAHPQARALRADAAGERAGAVADPFGGLTFEPPPGGPADGDELGEGDELDEGDE